MFFEHYSFFFLTDASPFPALDGRKVPVANYFQQLERLGASPELLLPVRAEPPRGCLAKALEVWQRLRPYGGYYTNERLASDAIARVARAEAPVVFVAPARLMSLVPALKAVNPATKVALILNDAQWTMNLEALLFGLGWYPGGARHDLLKGLLLPSALFRELNAYVDADCVLLQTERELSRLPWLRNSAVVAPNGVEQPKTPWVGQDSHVFAVQANFTNRRADKLRPFVTRIWPEIRAANPALELELFGPGSVLPAWAENIEGLRYVGVVDDLDAYLSIKRGFLVPLEHASGISNTVLRGLALDMPLVITRSSSLGVRSLLENRTNVQVARNAKEFVIQTLKLDPSHAEGRPQQIGSWSANLRAILQKLGISIPDATTKALDT